MVSNGTKHGFENYETFLIFGFAKELAFQVTVSEANQILSGQTISRNFLLHKHLSGDYEVVESAVGQKDFNNGMK